jgi:hypothetical protein
MVLFGRKNAIVMLKISGDTVQNVVTWNLCTLDTKLIHIMFETHTKSEIYPTCMGPVNNDLHHHPPPPTTAHIVVVLNWPYTVL